MPLPDKLELARLPTPIQYLPRLSADLGKQLYVWRDDLTGFPESGNKIRKLEFLLADALARKATWLVTCGGPQSNHARATAVLARRLGLGVTIVVRKPKGGLAADQHRHANLLLNHILGARLRFIEFEAYAAHDSKYDFFLVEEAGKLRAQGEVPYLIPEGGSNDIGALGYRAAIAEMLETWKSARQSRQSAPDSLFVALGSGGTVAGLHLGLEQAKLGGERLFAVSVYDDAAYFERRIGGIWDAAEKNLGLKVKDRKLQILDGYQGEGYALATDEELRFYANISRREGLLLDPCYTGKAFLGLWREVKKAPERFGENLLFVHTGGAFGNFAYGEQYLRALGISAEA